MTDRDFKRGSFMPLHWVENKYVHALDMDLEAFQAAYNNLLNRNIQFADTPSIDFNLISGSWDLLSNDLTKLFSAVVNLSQQAGNALTQNSDGLFVLDLSPQVNNLNNQMAVVQSEIGNFLGEVAALTNQVNNLQNTVNDLQNSVNNLASQLAAIQGDITNLQNEVNGINNWISLWPHGSQVQARTFLGSASQTGNDGTPGNVINLDQPLNSSVYPLTEIDYNIGSAQYSSIISTQILEGSTLPSFSGLEIYNNNLIFGTIFTQMNGTSQLQINGGASPQTSSSQVYQNLMTGALQQYFDNSEPAGHSAIQRVYGISLITIP